MPQLEFFPQLLPHPNLAYSTLPPCRASVGVLKHAAACNLVWGSFPSPLKSLVYALHKPEIVLVNVLLFWRKDLWHGEKGNFPQKNMEKFVKRNDAKEHGVTCKLTGKNKHRHLQRRDDTNEAKPLSKHAELGTQKHRGASAHPTLPGKPTMRSPRRAANPQANGGTKDSDGHAGTRTRRVRQRLHGHARSPGRRASTRRGGVTLGSAPRPPQ